MARPRTRIRAPRWPALLVLCTLTGACAPVYTLAQPPAAPAQPATGISAESSPYRIEWDGSRGALIRQAFAQEPERRIPLTYLHRDPGPAGYAKHLAWFLARDRDEFALVWCYLNDSGKDFWAWLYRFPSNSLTTLHFKGTYAFTPPEAAPAPVLADLSLNAVPRYAGPEFRYSNWTRREGALARLELREAFQPVATGAQQPPAAQPPAAALPVRTLTNLRVAPLHDVRVQGNNGWKEGGWQELHALAFDEARDPYYLILYTNTARGFVVDLKRAQNYVADFGTPVTFAAPDTAFGDTQRPKEEELPGARVRRGERLELTFRSNQSHANPFTDVILDVEFRTPDNRTVRVPAFWDGGGDWKIRYVPEGVGDWTWRTRSNDSDLHNQQGKFECITPDEKTRGFVGVFPGYASRHHFSYADGTPFLPGHVVEKFHTITAAVSAQASGTRLASDDTPAKAVPSSFVAFQKRLDALSALGLNRMVGGWLLDPAQPAANEGGTALTGGDLGRLNPAFFQWMDRRLEECSKRGIVPDVGLAVPGTDFFDTVSEADLRRFWRYVVARYNTYDVFWNLFGRRGATEVPPGLLARARELALLTQQNDPNAHPITFVTVAPPQPAPAPSSTVTPPPGPRPLDVTQVPPAPRKQVPPPPVLAPEAKEAWLDVLMFAGANADDVLRHRTADKPVVVIDTAPAADADAARHRLWADIMRGGYSVPAALNPATGLADLNAPAVQDVSSALRLLRRARYWRLSPHDDRLQTAAETTAQKTEGRRGSADRRSPIISKQLAVSQQPTTASVLADPGKEYLVYLPQGGSVTLDLLEATGTLIQVWFNPRTGEFSEERSLRGGNFLAFTPPGPGDWVLHVVRR